MKTIRLTNSHIYLDDYDISPFVVNGSLAIDGEKVTVVLIGDIQDEREAAAKPIKARRAKEVNDGDGTN